MKNYYEILGVTKDVTKDDLKKAFRKLARKYHPDVNPGNKEAEAKFKIINEAYNTLSDDSLRAAYDAKLEGNIYNYNNSRTAGAAAKAAPDFQPFNFDNLEQSFENFFGFNPKTKETTTLRKEKKRNPLDTSDLFEQYFQVKKK